MDSDVLKLTVRGGSEDATVSSPSMAVVKPGIPGVPGLPSNSWAPVMFPHQLSGYPELKAFSCSYTRRP